MPGYDFAEKSWIVPCRGGWKGKAKGLFHTQDLVSRQSHVMRVKKFKYSHKV